MVYDKYGGFCTLVRTGWRGLGSPCGCGLVYLQSLTGGRVNG